MNKLSFVVLEIMEKCCVVEIVLCFCDVFASFNHHNE